jgi:hypothetical protein
MLNRLAAMNVVTDAATNDDFSGVRALPGWAELEARLAGVTPAPAAPVTEKPAPTALDKPAAGKADKPSKPASEPPPVRLIPAPPPATPIKEGRKAKPAEKAAEPAPTPLTFSASGLTSAVGLAYDAVSGRFIIGDRTDRRLLVIGERSGRLASLVGADAGFNEISAFEIDTHEGDLWVVSTSPANRTSVVHKLQLISGRVLSSVALPADAGPAAFVDVAITPQSVLVLDRDGRRVFRLAKKGKTMEVAARLAAPETSSLAPAQDGVAFATYDAGVLKIDFATRNFAVVEPGEKVELAGLTWIRWVRGSLVGIQRSGEDSYRLVRVRLDDRGRTAKSVEVLDEGAPVVGPSSAALVGSTLHYLGRTAGSDDVIIKKLVVK